MSNPASNSLRSIKAPYSLVDQRLSGPCWTPEDRANVRHLLMEGQSRREIAEFFGLSRFAVANRWETAYRHRLISEEDFRLMCPKAGLPVRIDAK